jgi:DNA-binding MarR family transcriptional regulator
MDKLEVAEQIVQLLPFLLHKLAGDLRECGTGILPSHFRLLGSLMKGPCILSELADRQGVSLATMSNTVAIMVERGWIHRLPDLDDRRKVMLELTPLGREVSAEIHTNIKNSMLKLIISFPEEDIENLHCAFVTLRKALEQYGYTISFDTIPDPHNLTQS